MATTVRGVPYPTPGDPDNVPEDLHNLAAWVNDRPGVATLTTTERDALAGVELWDGRTILNTTLDRLQRYDLANTRWVSTTERSDVVTLIGRAQLDNASQSHIDTTSTTPVAVDAALQVTFTVPDSGVVYVRLRAYFGAGGLGATANHGHWSVMEGASMVAGTQSNVTESAISNGLQSEDVEIRVAGLTPSASKTWKWAHGVWGASNSVQLYYGGPEGTYTDDLASRRLGPATMEVWG